MSGVGCTVYVDGVPVPDGSPGQDPTAPVAMSGLEVTWGRETTMDQPDPASCTFEVWDPAGGTSFAGQLRTGRRVTVTASGTGWPDPDVPAFTDGSFEDGAATWTVTGASAAPSTRRASLGARSLEVSGPPGWVLRLAPAPFSAPGTAPDAWDHLPTTSPGQTWSLNADVYAPAGARLQVRPVLYAGPYAAAGTPAGPAQDITGTFGWAAVVLELRPTVAGSWVGLELTATATGWTWDQVPPTLAWDQVDPTRTWDDLGTVYVDDVVVLAPAGGNTHTVLVFDGRITDLEASDDGTGSTVQVTAQDFTADLDNVLIGGEPWPAEPLGDRAHRILNLTGLPVTIEVADELAPLVVSWLDVDAQGAHGLLGELAESADGVLWAAVHRTIGPYLVLEDPAARVALRELALSGGLIEVVPVGDPDTSTIVLSACDVLRDPVRWVQTVSDVLTRASVSWQEQTLNDEGTPDPTEHTVQVIDADAERAHGVRGVSVSTLLTAQPDAVDVAQRMLSRTSAADWRADGLVVDGADDATTLDLLDGTRRIGAPVLLTDLPATTPAPGDVPVYLEGGTYTFEGGAWVCELLVSSATGQGASAAWDELDPAWTWNQWDPALTWNDLRGVRA